MAISTETPASGVGRTPRRRLSRLGANWLMILTLGLTVGAGTLIGYWIHGPAQQGLKVFGPNMTFGEARALFPKQLAYLLGQQRRSDSLLFGEWARAKFAKRCRGLDPRSVSFTAMMQGPIDGGFRWDVLAKYDGLLPDGCQAKSLLVTLGAIMSDTGRIIPLDPDTGIGSSTFGVVNQGGKSNLVAPAVASKDAWWSHFIAGEQP